MSEPLQYVELATGANPKGCVIWMHGLGADGWDFVPIVKELGLPDDLPLRFVFPHAPMRPVTLNNGYVMRAWYDIAMTELQRLPDEHGIRESQKQIEALIARENSLGIPSNKIVLAGFSQGGAIALQTGLRHTEPLAGVLALSTYLALAESLAAEGAAANKNIPIFMAHGTEDPIVPIDLAKASRDTLKSSGYSVRWTDYPMPHAVCIEEIVAIGEWLVQRFKSRIILA
jgi:phospholipase/carboxylesterase